MERYLSIKSTRSILMHPSSLHLPATYISSRFITFRIGTRPTYRILHTYLAREHHGPLGSNHLELEWSRTAFPGAVAQSEVDNKVGGESDIG